MNLLFLTLVDITSIENHGIYEDLLREFAKHGHQVYVVSPTERRNGQRTRLIREEKATILKVRTGNVQKTNLIEKGLSTLSLEPLLIRAIKRYLKDIHFDLILYSTPPITWARIVSHFKRRDAARSFLLLKDIFPQNAVDLGMMKAGGLLHRYFKAKEKQLYAVSDRIGCMSPANVAYMLKHNLEIPPERVEVCPNSIEVQDINLSADEKLALRDKYGLPRDKKIFVYGGNLGKPQDVPFIIRCLEACRDVSEAFFLIVGSGTDYPQLEVYVNDKQPTNVKLLPSLPEADYGRMIACCNVGIIFLDHRFTIPNFPSRLLPYMQARLPVLVCTDQCTDVGRITTANAFGWQCESDDPAEFAKTMETVIGDSRMAEYGNNAFMFLYENYTNIRQYRIIEEAVGCSGDSEYEADI